MVDVTAPPESKSSESSAERQAGQAQEPHAPDMDPKVVDRLVVLTHREPFRIVERDGRPRVERTTGGMIAALEPAMRALEGLWISGDIRAEVDRTEIDATLEELSYGWSPVAFAEELYDDFYEGFSNQALWPLYHSFLGHTIYERQHWSAYRQVNERFAEVAAAKVEAGDFVWVHDYQLSLVPGLLRGQDLPPDVRIGYFLHIPFPAHAIFRTLPWAKQILKGMLGASLIGFHVAEYCDHFFDCVEEILGVRCDRLRGRIEYEGRRIHVRALPIGIDARQIAQTVAKPKVQEKARALREELGCEKLVIGVDRLDYTKGIPQRLQALASFFETRPHRRGQVSMVQVAVPSRVGIGEYQLLREEIERLVGRIDGLYARPSWTPLTYMFRSLPFEDLMALFLAADVALVTPLRDGMNLVAKEFVAANQNGTAALILSDLAGAAEQLTEAILVNPYDVDGMADALERALDTPPERLERRLRTMYAKVRRFDVHHWVETFLQEALYVE